MLFMNTKAHPGVVSESTYRVEVRDRDPGFFIGKIYIAETELNVERDDPTRTSERGWSVCVYDPTTEDLLAIIPHLEIRIVQKEHGPSPRAGS